MESSQKRRQNNKNVANYQRNLIKIDEIDRSVIYIHTHLHNDMYICISETVVKNYGIFVLLL